MGKYANKWEIMYNHAKRYYEKYGHLLIPYDYRIDEDDNELVRGTPKYNNNNAIKLGVWMKTQRDCYHGRCTGAMTEERKYKLNSIGMIWDKDDLVNANWNMMYEYAKRYYELHNNLDIPKDYRIDSSGNKLVKGTLAYADVSVIKLGLWVYHQRQAKTGASNYPLTPEQINKLENIGMEWNKLSRADICWNKMYEYAKKYYNLYNNLAMSYDCRIDLSGNELVKGTPEYESSDAIQIGRWITEQRQAKRGKNKYFLTTERTNKLDRIGMIWHQSNNKIAIIKLCEEYGIDLNLNQLLLRKSYLELYTKIQFLRDNHQDIVIDNVVHPIFFMSDINIQAVYGISMDSLIEKYANKKVR